MAKIEKRAFCVDYDTVHVEFIYDEKFDVWIGDFPYFDEEPRLTLNGRQWKNVSFTECPYVDSQYMDCGTCRYFKRQNKTDLIGVCFNDALRVDLK